MDELDALIAHPVGMELFARFLGPTASWLPHTRSVADACLRCKASAGMASLLEHYLAQRRPEEPANIDPQVGSPRQLSTLAAMLVSAARPHCPAQPAAS